jgi:hypothetical protein
LPERRLAVQQVSLTLILFGMRYDFDRSRRPKPTQIKLRQIP